MTEDSGIMYRRGCLVYAGVCVFVSALCVSNAEWNLLPYDLMSFFKSDNETENPMDKIRMIYYKRSPQKELITRSYLLDEAKELIKDIDLKKPYVLYIHGFKEHPTNESIGTVVSAYLQRGTDNIVVLDWSPVAFDNYFTVSRRAKDIAKVTAKAISSLAQNGLNVDTMHIVGHSMGSQIAGFVGQFLDFKIPRITGLDPANPLFYQFGAEHVNESSARQVDIIHSDGGYYGANPVTGSVDFFPNGGSRPQPGCSWFGMPLSARDLCSHWRSWRYWAESVVNEKAFPAVECASMDDFTEGKCKNNKMIYCGHATPKDVTGTYYFVTNEESPFGKGQDGIKPSESS